MSKIYRSVDELIGRTPIMELTNIEKELNLKANVLAKLEYFNPAGSTKDRAALQMINDAEKDGRLKKGGTIIEPTSGNTGIGLCAVAAARAYKCIIVMPDTMSAERRALMKLYGAELVLTDGSLGMSGAIAKADELNKSIPGSIVMGQFVNPSNPKAHYNSTAVEIWNDTDRNVDILVAGAGTGGTITGIGKYLKEVNPNVEIVAVEPDTSAVISGEKAGAHKLQGIGAGFIPEILDVSLLDKVMKISAKEAFDACHLIAKKEGILVGVSSGAAAAAAFTLASDEKNAGKNIVVILPDTGERYLSTPEYTDV